MLHREFSLLLHEFASAFSNEIPEFYYLICRKCPISSRREPLLFFFSLFSLSTRTTINITPFEEHYRHFISFLIKRTSERLTMLLLLCVRSNALVTSE